MANYRVITLDLGTKVNGQELVEPGKLFSHVFVIAYTTGAFSLLQFGSQGGKTVPVQFTGQVWPINPAESQGLYFTNTLTQPGKSLKLFIGFTSEDQPSIAAAGTFPQPYKVTTWRAPYRNAARPYSLSKALLINTETAFATIGHTKTAVRLVKLRHVWVALESVTAAGIYQVFLRRVSPSGSGGTQIFPVPANPANVANGSETTCFAFHTAGGGFASGDDYSNLEFNIGITPAAPAVNPPAPLTWFDLLNPAGYPPDDSDELPTIEAGVDEGWSVTVDTNVAATVNMQARIEFSEEIVA